MQPTRGIRNERWRYVDIGNEPALTLTGEDSTLLDRRQISLRWLAGTILTGIAGTALMGGALLAAVDGETRFAADPGRAQHAAITRKPTGNTPQSRKGDRLPPRQVVAPTRQIFQIATATRVGEKEIIKTKPFARVRAGLSLTRSEATSNIPAFNPAKIFAESGAPSRAAQPQPATRESEAEMTLVVKPLEPDAPFASFDELSTLQIQTLVKQTIAVENAAALSLPRPVMSQSEGAVPGMMSFSTPGSAESLARVVPENITAISKSSSGGEAVNPSDEKTVNVKRGDTLATILVGNGASLEEARLIIEVLSRNFKASDLHEGHRIKIAVAPTETDPKKKMPVQIVIYQDKTPLAAAVLTDVGQYAAIDPSTALQDDTPAMASSRGEEEEEGETETATTTSLYTSLYETALGQGIPRKLIDELVRIYAADFDFQRRVRPGDSFEVFYAASEEAGGTPERGDILYTSLSVNGETHRYYRFRTEDDGNLDYYDEKGRSSKKFLMRKPMNTGVFRSGYGWRRHPVLGYSRLHAGVDWAAPVGTPIMAAGSGTVLKSGWSSGYGRRVELQHANGYVTTYNHMSGFGRGITAGARVHQGQIVGYLGSSGLSTGPHLHYEVRVNGTLVDPMRIRVPRGRVLEGRLLAEYEREIEHIEHMMRRPQDTAKIASQR